MNNNEPGGDIESIEIILNAVKSATEKSKAREVLYLRYFDDLVKYGIQVLRLPKEDAEDLAHDALIRALMTKTALFTPQPGSTFKSWLRTIMRNLNLNEVQSAKNAKTTSYDAEFHEKGAVSPASEDNLLLVDNDPIYIAAGLSKLEHKVIQLNIDEELPPRDIAEIIPGQSPENISRIIYKAKAKLREFFATETTG